MNKSHPFDKVLTTSRKAELIKDLIWPELRINSKILDIGCGSGYLLWKLYKEGCNYYGIDMSCASLDLAKEYVKADLKVADAHNLPFQDGYFDLIICTDVLEHFADDNRAVLEISRVLRKGGTAFFYTPTTSGILSKTPFVDLYHTSDENYMKDYRYYDLEKISNLMKNKNFNIEMIGYHNIFIQELITQLLKLFSSKVKIEYNEQADIKNFIKSKYYLPYNIIYPLISLICTVEELLNSKIFKYKLLGHRLFVKVKKI
jgi:ubiquinone/menaquinone biosynthesis C-methylase UbiE